MPAQVVRAKTTFLGLKKPIRYADPLWHQKLLSGMQRSDGQEGEVC